jgi:hypothetical protein
MAVNTITARTIAEDLGTMRRLVLSISAAAVLIALPWSAYGQAEHICEGELEQMQDHDNIGDCVLMYNTKAFTQERLFCKGDTPYCKFIGHVARRVKEPDGGISYYIDRIIPQTE